MDYQIGYLIKSINDRIKIKADSDLKKHNLTLAQSRVLVFINQHDGQVTQKQIEDHLKVSHPTVVGIIARMQKNGFVTCQTDKKDHRNKLVALTPMAKKTGRNMSAVIKEMDARMLEPLTAKQADQLGKMLTLIDSHLENE